MKKILYGVCGIGNGHTYRQLPTLNYLAQSHKILIFAYADSLKFFSTYFRDHKNVEVVEVAVPYYVGSTTGIDFAASAIKAKEAGVNYVAVNSQALHKAYQYLGKADLVISDYEPICAQFAYAYNIPLVTIDQQSKYLSGDFPTQLHNTTYIEEVVRLRMFFPLAAARIACSFFAVQQLLSAEKVLVYPPVLREELTNIKQAAVRKPHEILVYLTAQAELKQSLNEVLAVLQAYEGAKFHVFIPQKVAMSHVGSSNVAIYPHGHDAFQKLLGTCSGIIATAGHSLLSEAMYLGVPVLAMPLPLYEQQMNAEVIDRHAFGVASPVLSPKVLQSFIAQIPRLATNIENDTTVLLRGDGKRMIIDFLERNFLTKNGE